MPHAIFRNLRCIHSLPCLLALTACGDDKGSEASDAREFVTRNGAELELRGEPFRFAGSNNYYLYIR